MKAFKYLMLTLAIVGLLATATWFARNTLIQRFSKSKLSDYDIEIVDISLDALATNRARIGYLELVHAKGTTIVVKNLTLPINTPSDRFDVYSAERVSIVTSARADEAPIELAALIDQFLSLTNAIPQTEIHIGEISVATYPPIHKFDWSLSKTGQSLSGIVGNFEFSLATTSLDATSYQFELMLSDQVGPGENRIAGTLQRNDQRITISGDGKFDLPGLAAIAKVAGIVPGNINFVSGAAELKSGIEIPYDVGQSPTATISLTPTNPWRIDYQLESGDSAELLVTSVGPIDMSAKFPTIEWSLNVAQASLLATVGDWKDIPVSLNNTICVNGPSCSMDAAISWQAANLPFASAQNIEMSAVLGVTFPASGVLIGISPEARLSLKKFSIATTSIELLEATLVSDASLKLLNAGWQFDANSLDASVQSISAGDEVFVTAPVFLENVHAEDLAQGTSATLGVYTPAISAALHKQVVSLPGLRGTASLNGTDLLFDLETIGLQQNGRLTVQENIDSGIGSMKVENAAVSFSSKKLSRRVSPWKYHWDLIAGVTGIDGQANWTTIGEDVAVDGQVSITVADAAGFYADTVVAGLSTDLEIGYSTAGEFTTKPSSVRVALVDLGLPVENITADYTLDLNALAADVRNLRMTAFGGSIWADPFSFHTDTNSNNLTVHAESIQLDEILSLKEFEAVSVTGSVGATLPVTIENDKIRIAGGKLFGDAPGGVIRYNFTTAPDPKSASSMDLVTRALSNFVYETLTSDVDYNDAGDLVLKTQIKGRNPDMEGNRPVILNLSVENNVPQMIRSLQAARAVEDVLEKRMQK